MLNSLDSRKKLAAFVTRLVNIAEEKSELNMAIKDVYTEAVAEGFDKKVLQILVRELKRSEEEIEGQREAVLIYRHSLAAVGEDDEI